MSEDDRQASFDAAALAIAIDIARLISIARFDRYATRQLRML
jgi:hypothetical protein